jgi:hypothetical protein
MHVIRSTNAPAEAANVKKKPTLVSKRDLRCKQKRPAMHGNEACVHAHMRRRIHACHMRRRIHACQKRLTLVSKETYTVSNETYTSVKRDLRTLGGALVPPLTPCSLLA